MVAKAKEEASAEAESRMQVVLAQQETKFAELEGKFNLLSQQKQERPPATREELRALVENGRITQDAMDAELDKQRDVKLEQLVEARVAEKTAEAQTNRDQGEKFAAYVENYPDLDVPGSKDRVRHNRRYAELTAQGMPTSPATELLALELEFGKPDKPKPVTRETRDTDEGLSGAGEPSDDLGDESTKAEAKAKEMFTPAQRAHYEKRIGQGHYNGWSDPQLQKEARRAAKIRKAKG